MKTKVLIVVKAYPAVSKKYFETVCTAGITEEGQWIRIYPIPYRLIDYSNQFRKYEWIEIDLVKNKSDFRPESYRPVDKHLKDLKSLGFIKSDSNTWSERREYVLKNIKINLASLIDEAHNRNKCTSIALFKPSKILDFTYEKVESSWNKKILESLNSKKLQLSLFESKHEDDIENFELVNKLPFKFSFVFEDDSGQKSKMLIEDWETGMLYWNCLFKNQGDENLACLDVKKKYFDDFAKNKDYYFILGTTKLNHFVSRNPFVIIGDFRPKFIMQDSLF